MLQSAHQPSNIRVLHCLFDSTAYCLKLFENVTTTETQNSKALLSQICRAHDIMLALFFTAMHFAIELDDESGIIADEIDNLWPHWPLGLEARLVIVEKVVPEMTLRWSHCVAEGLCTRLRRRSIITRHIFILAFFVSACYPSGKCFQLLPPPLRGPPPSMREASPLTRPPL